MESERSKVKGCWDGIGWDRGGLLILLLWCEKGGCTFWNAHVYR